MAQLNQKGKTVMKKQTAVLLTILIGVILLIGIGQFLVSKQRRPSDTTSLSRSAVIPTFEANSPTITTAAAPTQAPSFVSIDFGDGKKLSGKTLGKNAYAALTDLAKENNLTVEMKQYKYGKLVVKIGQKENSATASWSYLVNSKPGQIAADSFLIYPGDKVDWVYKKM